MNLQATISIWAFHPLGLTQTRLEGFTNAQQEQIRAVLSEIPAHLKTNFKAIIADPSLGAKHGQYDEDTHVIKLNPRDFSNRTRFGRGPGRKLPHVDLTLAHECGHSVFYQMSPAEQDAWKRLSGWQAGKGDGQAPPYKEKRPGWKHFTADVTHSKGAGFTRYYAEKNWHEDFADSFGFFVMGQKDRLPENKRAFMDRIFQEFKKKQPEGLQ
jgi:hypothetical protein